MTDKEIAQAIRRADADALRHQLDDSKIVLCEAGIALHRRYGWGSKRLGDLCEALVDEWNRFDSTSMTLKDYQEHVYEMTGVKFETSD